MLCGVGATGTRELARSIASAQMHVTRRATRWQGEWQAGCDGCGCPLLCTPALCFSPVRSRRTLKVRASQIEPRCNLAATAQKRMEGERVYGCGPPSLPEVDAAERQMDGEEGEGSSGRLATPLGLVALPLPDALPTPPPAPRLATPLARRMAHLCSPDTALLAGRRPIPCSPFCCLPAPPRRGGSRWSPPRRRHDALRIVESQQGQLGRLG